MGKDFRNKTFRTIELHFDKKIGGSIADKPIMNENADELCLCVDPKYRGKLNVCNILDKNKPKKVTTDSIRFYYLKDRKIYISTYLFIKEDEYGELLDDQYRANGEWGYQLVLIDYGDHYLLDYQDGFITGDARGGDDFQELTADWQW